MLESRFRGVHFNIYEMTYETHQKAACSDGRKRHSPKVLVACLHVFAAIQGVSDIICDVTSRYPAMSAVVVAPSVVKRTHSRHEALFATVFKCYLHDLGRGDVVQRPFKVVPGPVIDIIVSDLQHFCLYRCGVVCMDVVLG